MRRAALTALAMCAACGGSPPTAPSVPRGQKLAAPLALDATAPGAMYLTLFSGHVQPNWSQFLEDCRLRLAPTHPLNDSTLVAVAEIAIDRGGAISLGTVRSSGNADFDHAVSDVVRDVHTVEPPPTDLLGDDDRLHLEWTFARDGRQAGAAFARMVPMRQQLLDVTPRLLAQSELPRAARRIALDDDGAGRDDAARLVAVAAVQEALAGSVDVRVVAVDAIGRAKIASLAPEIREMLSTPLDSNLQIAVTRTLATLHDAQSIEPISHLLGADLSANESRALADTIALVQLGAGGRAAEIIEAFLALRLIQATGPRPPNLPPPVRIPAADTVAVALHLKALAPTPYFDARFTKWFANGDARLRAAVCAAQPVDASATMGALIAKGLRDADASVRASCAEAAGRQLGTQRKAPTAATRAIEKRLEGQLRDLTRDRDRLVRANAFAALVIATSPFARNHMDEKVHRMEDYDFTLAASDSAPEVRVTAIDRYTSTALIELVNDPDPTVRAAAFRAWATFLPRDNEDATRTRVETATHLASDAAANVRLAAIPELTDPALLHKLAAGDTYDVASAALIRLATLRGRGVSTGELLLALAQAPPASADRVRIALAWLLAP